MDIKITTEGERMEEFRVKTERTLEDVLRIEGARPEAVKLSAQIFTELALPSGLPPTSAGTLIDFFARMWTGTGKSSTECRPISAPSHWRACSEK